MAASLAPSLSPTSASAAASGVSSRGLGSPAPFAYSFKAAGGGAAAMSRSMHTSIAIASSSQGGGEGSSSSSGSGLTSPRATLASPRAFRVGGSSGGGFMAPGAGGGSGDTGGALPPPTSPVGSPKVFLPHARSSGSPVPPRRVAVERRRREIANAVSGSSYPSSGGEESMTADGLEEALVAAGIDLRRFPGGVPESSGGPTTTTTTNAMPLHYFVDMELDSHSGEDWVAAGCGALALDFAGDGRALWRPARALSFSPHTNTFSMVWLAPKGTLPPLEASLAAATGTGTAGFTGTTGTAIPQSSHKRSALHSSLALARSLEEGGGGGEEGASALASTSIALSAFSTSSSTSSSIEAKEGEAKLGEEVEETPNPDGTFGTPQDIPRLYICFSTEHPWDAVARFTSAYQARRAAESALRYSLALDCMPREEGGGLTREQVARLVAKAKDARSLKLAARDGEVAEAAAPSTDQGTSSSSSSSSSQSEQQALLGDTLLRDVTSDWAKAMNRVYFDVVMKLSAEATAEGVGMGSALSAALGISSGGLPLDSGSLGGTLTLPPLPQPRPAPLKGMVSVVDEGGSSSSSSGSGSGSGSVGSGSGSSTGTLGTAGALHSPKHVYGAADFWAAKDAFLFNTFLSVPEALKALQAVAVASEKVWPGAKGGSGSSSSKGVSSGSGVGVPLITVPASSTVTVDLSTLCLPGGGSAGVGILLPHPGKASKVEEYEHVNAGKTADYCQGLRDGWGVSVRNAVRENLGKAGKGNMNLKETQEASYQTSKLRRLLRSINFRMRDDLRAAILMQLHDFVASIEASCSATVTVGKTPAHVTSVFPPDSPAARRPTLFVVDVLVSEERVEVKAPPPPPPGAKDKAPAAAAKKAPEGPPAPPVFTTRRKAYLTSTPAAIAAAPVNAFSKALAALCAEKESVTTVERQVMDRLFWSHDPKIPTVLLQEGVTVSGAVVYPTMALKERLVGALSGACGPLEDLIKVLLPTIDEVLQLDPEGIAAGLQAKFSSGEGGGGDGGSGGFNLAECRTLISKHRAAATAILDLIPPTIPVGGLVTVNCSEVRLALAKRHNDTADAVVKLVAVAATEASLGVHKEYESMAKHVNQPPHDIESLTATQEFIKGLGDKVKDVQVKHEANSSMYAALEAAAFPLTKDMFDALMKSKAGAVKVWKAVGEQEKALELERARYGEELASEQKEFEDAILSVSELVSSLNRFDKLDHCEAAAYQCAKIKDLLDDADAKSRLYNSREALFGKDCTDYERLGDIKKSFDPFVTLWESANSWRTLHKKWMTSPFTSLDAEAIERDAGSVSRNMARSIKTFERMTLEGCVAVSKTIRDECEEFKPLIPLITALRNPGMRPRHWEELSALIQTKVDPEGEGAAFTLPRVIELRLGDYMEQIVKVGERAGKEYQIEVALDKMTGEWQDVFLDIAAYRETGTYVLRGVDELQTLLDEHTTMTQAMSFSTFKKPFAERIDAWAASLMTVSEVLDEWLKVQRSWMYLEPIFSSADIQKQLPTEYKRFAAVDKNWRSTLVAARGGASATPTPQKAIQFCANQKLLERWQEGNRFLELVQKGLSDYLETKRAGFPRFYFLSNDELLEILSQTKDPRAVQPHLKKCFEGIRSVVFESDKIPVIKGMISGEKEQVGMCVPVDPRGKNVEVWMSEVEMAMKRSIRRVMLDAVADYTVTPRTEWVQKWPGMCVLNASQLHWTKEMEEGIREKGNQGVVEYVETQMAQLKDMVMLIRGKLAPLARITLGSLTVIDVHARDVTKKMAASGVSAVNDFDWISQLRYYVYSASGGGTGNPANPNGGEEDGVVGEMFTHMISAKRPYGYEYLGNSLRLVITPLTDKCYMTLMGALEMNLGGAPAGPAGTGKTETTKDLAKALAKYCVVFNCSDGLDYLAMGKFFKGLASCGAWACFDEFNRIDLEVLSVIAQQVLTLQQGVAQGIKRLMFEGTDIRLDPQFAAFITMNPGYAGRSELPDNLKALFRPVAMMVPDYALIGEIMLYSFGFELARGCAEKMVATFKLCSEQLSSQDHYDYGMRAVKTTITAAGNLKSTYPQDDEEELLYRALSDVNLPKFLAPDLPLFKGIMSDLFPRIAKVSVDHGDLNTALVLCSEKKGLQPVPFFLTKCVQVYEMVVVRHGMMMVGPTGGGKSQMLKVTQAALTLMTNLGRGGPKIARVEIKYINPKAVTMGQLYGQFDDNTHEWTDGILADVVRDCAKSTTPDLKWVNFDGPVDAIWIENMNTVLDDNKKLCLVSGEIVALSAEMTMMFEVEDLAVASPATVSRCGMVYTEPTSLGFDPPVLSWVESLPPSVITPPLKATLLLLFDTYFRSTIYFLRRYLEEPVPTSDNALALSVCKLLDTFIEPLEHKEGRESPSDATLKTFATQFPAIFMFCLVWGAAGTSNTQGRARFNAFLRGEMDAHAFPFPFPPTGQLYDFAWSRDTGSWLPWMSTVPSYEPPKNAKFSELIVPTKDTVRYKYLARALLTNRKFFLLAGPTGVGKTVDLAELLSSEMPKEYIPLMLTFSAQTSANQTQDLIDGKLEKRQRGQYGPPAGSTMVLFVDDMNMPQKEKYGAQPPIEILRQWADYSGWYERKERVFRKVIDMVALAAMGPPGGGRNHITMRFVRHFVVVNATPMDDASMSTIFTTVLQSFTSNPAMGEDIKEASSRIVQASIKVYNTMVLDMLPTPAKPHYTFNLRDLGKVFQGMLQVDPKRAGSVGDFCRLWVHENRRVYQDRLVNADDRGWFDGLLKTHLEGEVGQKWGDVVGDRPTILFGDYMVPGADPRVYAEVANLAQLQPIVEEYLGDYNGESKQPMPLVLFLDALEHVSRVARIIRQPGGNALLLGVGGSGRQSLSRLATFMQGFALQTLEISKGYGKNEWREDLKKLLLKAGVEKKPTVFLFTDTQIVFEGMVEDINNVLNSGDVPNLYAAEDLDNISNACRQDCLTKKIPPTKINIMAAYLARVKENVHVVLCFSPMGDAFRNRLRMFPALVNCTTIDWFSEWPGEALTNVGTRSLTEGGKEGDGDPMQLGELLPTVVEFFKFAQQAVSQGSTAYALQRRRFNYVTPTSYLELLGTFKTVLKRKREEVGTLRTRLQNGLDKIISTEGVVSKLQTELVAMQPVLAKTQTEVAAMIVQIDKDKAGAAETKAVVEQEKAAAAIKEAETNAIAADAQADLDKALPALDAATECLKSLKTSDIQEVKALANPPFMVKYTLMATCIMFNIKPNLVNDPENPGKKIKDYFQPAKLQILNDAKAMLNMLMNFDKDNIPEATIKAVQECIDYPDFNFEKVNGASKATGGLCLWVRAMHTYYFVAKNVEPKRQALAAAKKSLEEVQAKVAVLQADLDGVEAKIKGLEAAFKGANDEKERLANEVALASARLGRAHKLLGGLGGEKGRWTDTVAGLNVAYTNLVGDSLLASAAIAYLGAFTPDFRKSLVESMQEELVRLNLPHTGGANLISVLADPVQVRSWTLAGLPTDNHSVENGIIMSISRRWPLLIDPQGQANRFIKNMGKSKDLAPNGLKILRMSDGKFLQGLENGIRFGNWVLVENVGESLEASLEPVLLRQVFKQGGADMIRLGDSTVPYNSDFRLFMTSTLPNPHYAPETQVKVCLLNFTLTPKGLEDQMLGVFVVTELPELEERKSALVLGNARNKNELAAIENKILQLLSNSTGNILDDEELINTLADSKVKSEAINAAVKEAEVTEREIDATRESFRAVAFRSSLLYFCICALAGVEPMYQYSLPWFQNLFVSSVRNSPAGKGESEEAKVASRIQALNDWFTYSIYKNVCRSLFEAHKPLFSLLLTISILQGDGAVDANEWRFLLSGLPPAANPAPLHNPAPSWLTDAAWLAITNASMLPNLAGLDKDMVEVPAILAGMNAVFDSNEAHNGVFPGKYGALTGIPRMCLLRTLRQDKVMLAAQDFVIREIGQRFVEPPPFDLAACYEDASTLTPLIFVLSAGSDPTRSFYAFAETLGMNGKVSAISLGQGQGGIAARMIEDATQKGGWVLLQNCHLSLSWMPELERIVEALEPDKIHQDFRLWLTSMPTPLFPVSILQGGVKMTNEPPKGLKANIRNSFYQLNDEVMASTHKPEAFRKLLFGLAFFHAVIQERKRFGALGWNRPYDFNESDMEISKAQMAQFLDEYEVIPYRVIHFCTNYIHYGGRVTDDKDLRTIDVILRDYVLPDIVEKEDYKFTPSGVYYAPTLTEATSPSGSMLKGCLEYIEGLPLNADPEVFGMHANANITCELTETELSLEILLSLQPKDGGGGGKKKGEKEGPKVKTRDEIIAETAEAVLAKLPPSFDVEAIQMAYPVVYNESMNTVLAQECIRYNKLTSAVRSSLREVGRALKGLTVMSKELDEVGTALAANKVPLLWESKSYPSLKPLASYVADLMDRLAFIGDWVSKGSPAVYWISGFFFPQAFFTGTMQNYARGKALPIDTLQFDFKYLSNQPWEGIAHKPEAGCYIRGLFLEGARFDESQGKLEESIPKLLFSLMPVIHLEPRQFRQPTTSGIYRCPVYKILSRWGVLATTGHSSNFVMFLEIPTDKGDIKNNVGEADCGKWVRAGVAAFTQLKT